MKPKQQSVLGIDISSSSIKILQLSSSSDHTYCVEGYGALALPANAMEGAIVKDISAVADTIQQVVSSSRLTSKLAVLAVPDASAISKIIQISEGLTESDIEEMVIIEADRYIPYPIDEINLDFSVIGPSAKNSAMQDVLIVASRSEIVSNRVEAVKLAGLEPKIVDIESYAIERAAQLLTAQMPAQGENKVIAIIDIGAIYAHLFVLQNMKIIYSREEEFGGHQLIEAYVQEYGVTPAEAMKAITTEIVPIDFETRVLASFNEKLFMQVKRTLQFFFSTSQYSFVDHIVLVGGVARQPGLAAELREHIGIPTTIGNPLASMKFAKSVDVEKIMHDSPSLLLACGLALRKVD